MPTATHQRARRLPSIFLSTLALLAVAALGTARAAAAGTSSGSPVTITPLESANPIAAAAIGYIGNYEGECFPWVRRVVQQATGRSIGFDYRSGYLEAGAVEVTLDEARPGDVIQLVNDANTSPLADYAGLHTSIVFANYGGGRFDVIDSNSEWLGIVRLRTGYEPLANAARYAGISVHVYRFPETSTAPAVSVPVDPAPAASSQLLAPATPGGGGTTPILQSTPTATVDAGGDCLNMRSAPSLTGGILTCIPDGATVSVLPSQQSAGGITWQLVAYNGLSGWVSNEFLAHAASTPTPTVTTTPTPTTTATPGATVTATPTSSATPTADAPVPGDSGIIGDLPQGGGLGLIVYGGGTIDSLVAASNARGCAPVSVWANRSGGGLIGVIPGAPALVNREWTAQFGGGPIPAASPLIIVCRGPSSATPPPASGTTAPSSGGTNGPPGPAGNE